MHIGLHIKYPLFLSNLNETEFSRQTFGGGGGETKNIKCNENPCSGSGVVSCEQTDGQTDMTNLTVPFRNFVTASRKRRGAEGPYFTRPICVGYLRLPCRCVLL
jgi:hypothetical protein